MVRGNANSPGVCGRHCSGVVTCLAFYCHIQSFSIHVKARQVLSTLHCCHPFTVPLCPILPVAGSVRCLEVVAVEAAVVEAAVLLRRHHSHLCCQSINLQTFATGEKKC